MNGVWVAPTPHLVAGELKQWADNAGVECVRVPGYWLEKEGRNREAGEAPLPGEKVVYHLHGGGYADFSAHPTDITASIPRGIIKHSDLVMRAFSIEYRLSKGPPLSKPAHPFPAALLDALAGYNYLVNTVKFKPEDIIVEGDSAGGNLALALVRYLVEYRESKSLGTNALPPPPGELVLCSPWADIGDSDVKPSMSMYTNIPYDYISLVGKNPPATKVNFVGPLGMTGANSNRYISPSSTAPTMGPVSFKGFPRTFISAGGAEILVDQIRVLRDRMIADIGEGQVEYYEVPDGIHDYMVLGWHEPERTETMRRIANWIAVH